jgi:hypothetical protein
VPAEDNLKRDLKHQNSGENFESQLLPLQSVPAEPGPNFRSRSTRENSTETLGSGLITSVIDTKDWMALVRVVKLKNRQELKFSHAELDGAEEWFQHYSVHFG